MRIIIVGIFWSIFFLEGIRVIMLTNWRFDILRPRHWEHAWNLWLSGWVIDDPKEWAFVLIILTFIPLWLSGWAALSMIRYGRIFGWVMFFPLKFFNKIFEKPVKTIANVASVKVVKKKKSYKEIRPRSLRPPMDNSSPVSMPQQPSAISATTAAPSHIKPTAPVIAPAAAPAKPAEFDHSLFQFDDEPAEFDFDLFDEKPKEKEPEPATPPPAVAPAPEPPAKERGKNNRNKNNRNNRNSDSQNQSAPAAQPAGRGVSNSTLEVLKQKGYEVITSATIKNTLIDFIGVSADQICLCLNDKEPGDWLADEERFNDEEPLWFSESSHRISPVRKIDIARLILKDKLAEADMDFKVEAYVIEQIGNIINAEDMFEIWDEIKINVTRIDRGTPKELKLFAKALDDANGKISHDKFEKIKKLVRSIA